MEGTSPVRGTSEGVRHAGNDDTQLAGAEERLITLGRLSGLAAHALGAPLTVAMARARLLAENSTTASRVADEARNIVTQCKKMAALLTELASMPTPRPCAVDEPIDLVTLTMAAMRRIEPTARARGIELAFEMGTPPPATTMIVADGVRVELAVINLALDLLEMSPRPGRIVARIEHVDPCGLPGLLEPCRFLGVSVLPRERRSIPPGVAGRVHDVDVERVLGFRLADKIARAQGGAVVRQSDDGYCLMLPRGEA